MRAVRKRLDAGHTARKERRKFELHHLRVFRAVALAGSFTLAASRLGYSQSTVTHQIKTLERELGASLLTRSRFSKSLELTKAGYRVLEYADLMLALAEEATVVVRTLG